MMVIFNRYFSEVARYFREVAIEDKRKQVLKEETWKFHHTPLPIITTHHYLPNPIPNSVPKLQSPRTMNTEKQ